MQYTKTNNKKKTIMSEKTNKEMEMVNPEDFSYRSDGKIEIDPRTFQEVESLIGMSLEEEQKEFFKMEFLHINQKGEIASAKEIKEGNSDKIPDIRAIFSKNEPDNTYLTKKGLALLNLKLRWEEIHYDNIRSGKAVPIQTLIEEEANNRMKLVEEAEKEEDKQNPLTIVK